MAYVFTAFPEADESPLSQGNTWDAGPGSVWANMQLRTNSARIAVTNTDGGARRNSPVFTSDQFVMAQTSFTAGDASLLLRMQSASVSDCYQINRSSTQIAIYHVIEPSTFTPLGAVFGTAANLDWLRVEAVGATLALIKNGVLQGTRTDGSPYSGGQPGLAISNTTGVDVGFIDNWSAGDLVAFSPAIVALGTAAYTASSGATVTPGMPTGFAANDILLIQAETNNNGVWNPTTYTGWTIATDGTTPLDANNTANQRFTIFWKRAVGGDTAPALALTTNTVTIVRGARMMAIRNCRLTDPPFEVCGLTATATAAATVSYPSVTTLTDRALVLALGQMIDNPTGTSTPAAVGWGAPAGGLVSTTLGTAGNQIAFNVFALYQDVLGATGATTSTMSGASNSISVGAVLAFPPNVSVAAGGLLRQMLLAGLYAGEGGRG